MKKFVLLSSKLKALKKDILTKILFYFYSDLFKKKLKILVK